MLTQPYLLIIITELLYVFVKHYEVLIIIINNYIVVMKNACRTWKPILIICVVVMHARCFFTQEIPAE